MLNKKEGWESIHVTAHESVVKNSIVYYLFIDCTVSQAYFALQETLHKVQNLRKKSCFGTKVTSEAFLSISQNLKVTRLQGGTQTKR
jgi:hypothetical protein